MVHLEGQQEQDSCMGGFEKRHPCDVYTQSSVRFETISKTKQQRDYPHHNRSVNVITLHTVFVPTLQML